MNVTDSRCPTDIQIFIPGTARPQPRPRFAKGRVISTADAKAKRWIAAAEFYAKQTVANLGGPKVLPYYLGDKGEALRAEMYFVFPAANQQKVNIGKPHTRTPDADNLAKLILDAFVRCGLILGDDSRVTELFVKKTWGRIIDAGCMVNLKLITPPKSEKQTEMLSAATAAP